MLLNDILPCDILRIVIPLSVNLLCEILLVNIMMNVVAPIIPFIDCHANEKIIFKFFNFSLRHESVPKTFPEYIRGMWNKSRGKNS